MTNLLNDAQLNDWASAVLIDLRAVGHIDDDRPGTLRSSVRRRYKDEPAGPYVAIDFVPPHWSTANKATLELYPDARVRWRSASATAMELYSRIDAQRPRWRVPPSGGPAWAVTLTERNGWEGESWSFSFPIAQEAAAIELVRLHRPSRGHDARVTPFDPISLATFGSWALRLSYRLETHAREQAAKSGCGYMPRFNWDDTAGSELAAVLDVARERGVLHWGEDSGKAGVFMWKARVYVQDENGDEIAEAELA